MPKTNALPQAILFDWDNTLADTWAIIFAALTETFLAMGHEPWSREDVLNGREGIHHSLKDSFPRIFGDDWQKAREIYYQNFLKKHLEEIRKVPGADELLAMLARTDIYVAIVSNKTGKYLREEVEHLGWSSYFRKIVGASDASADKPHVAPVHMALADSGIAPGTHVWFVGDSRTDLECAENSGCTPVLFGHSEPAVSYLPQVAKDGKIVHHVADHPALVSLIQSLL